MNKNTAATATFDRFTRNDEWAGWGYLGERAHALEAGESALVAQADAAVVAIFAEAGLGEDAMFEWANSKAGRWFGDTAFGGFGVERAVREARELGVGVL